MTEFTFKQLQEEQKPWVKHNFGDRPAWMPLLGIAEEIGELSMAAELKDSDEFEDALADIMIYISDYCEGMGWSLHDIFVNSLEPWYLSSEQYPVVQMYDQLMDHNASGIIFVCLSKIMHHHLKSAQGIRGTKEEHDRKARVYLGIMLYELSNLAGGDDTLLNITKDVWDKVKQRDWKKNATTGV